MSSADNMAGISLGLARISTLLAALHSPHLATPIIHIAGTNGKGSVAAYLSSILLESCLRVGRFNSPHLVDEWDCLQIGGKTIDRRTFEEARDHVRETDRKSAIGATSFELLTATAFEVFRRAEPKLDVAIVEVGMGGQTDATNVVDAEKTLMSIVTSIELDHQKFLGDTVEEIAAVKAGIVKEGVDVVLAKQNHKEVEQVLEQVADATGASISFAGEGTSVDGADRSTLLPLSPTRSHPTSSSLSQDTAAPPLLVHLPLPGTYQLANAAAATVAAHALRTSSRATSLLPSLSQLTDSHIRQGIEATRWPGRLDWLSLRSTASSASHRLLIDGAHNPSSATHLAHYLACLPPSESPSTLIIGLSSPRVPSTILAPLLGRGSRIKKVVCVPFTEPESMPWIKATAPGDIANAVREMAVEQVLEKKSFEAALNSLQEGEIAVVAGSLYLAADVYRLARREGEGL